MIFFVWSLVLSAVQFARRQRLVSVLSEYFIWNLSHNSVLLCRKIPCFSCSSSKKKSYERLTDTVDMLRKTSSEPCLPGELITRPIYRNEEMEFVVQSDATQLDIVDWNIFTPPIHGSIPRVHFIAFLDKKTDEYNETLDGITVTDSVDIIDEQSSIISNTIFSSGLPSVLIGNLCNKIAHRRGRPWEILYECTLYDFYDIAFAWSQNILFDIGGKAVVKMMKVVTLPAKFFLQLDDSNSLQRCVSPPLSCGEWGINSSRNSLSPEPLSLLELLYEREHSCMMDKDDCRNFYDSSVLSSFHNNDSTLHYDNRQGFPAPSILSVDTPNNDYFGCVRRSNLSRSRACSVSLERTKTVLNEAASFYIRYLKEQNKMNKSYSKSQQFGSKTRFARVEQHMLHSSVNSLCNQKRELREMDGHANCLLSRVSTDVVPKEINGQLFIDYSSVHVDDANTPVKLTKDNVCNIGKYQFPNELNHPSSVEQNLISNKMDQIQLQLKDDRITSDQIISYQNRVQMKPSQILIRSDQGTAIGKVENQNTSNAGSIGKTERKQFSKRIVNAIAPEKNESNSSTSVNEGACKFLSATDCYNIFPTSALIQSPSLFLSSKEQSVLLSKKMFRIFNGSHLHTAKDGGKILTKPLMILVFTGDNDDLFNRILETLNTMIPSDTHTVYHLSYEAFCKHPWIGQNIACLIVADTSHLDDKCWIRLQQYFSCSGKILFLCQNKLLASLSACDNSKKTTKLLKMAFGERQSKKLGKDFEHFLKKTLKMLHKEKKVNQTFHAKDLFGSCKYSVVLYKTEDSPLLLYMENAAQRASALFSDATSEQLLHSGSTLIADALSRLSIKITTNVAVPSLTPGYFICEYDRMPWDMEGMHFNEPFGSKPKLLLKQINKHGPLPEVSNKLLPVEVRTRAEHLHDFDDEIYFKRLKTVRLGKALLYIPVCETTMDIGKSLACAMPEEPIVIVARQQIKGAGRSGNQWLSPVGCAMFTVNYMLSPESSLNNNISIIQHIFCVAIVSGICSLRKELENFPLKIKWPNDLYYGRTCKLGGLIVNATTINDRTVCTIGAGLNLSNSKPTACINDFLPADLRIRQEDYIANTLNKFQYYIDLYENEGENAFLKHYYRFWLHSREEVTISNTNEKAVIRGLDRHGFLKVRSRQSGKMMIVHPDGNTFDMMKGLITAKYV